MVLMDPEGFPFFLTKILPLFMHKMPWAVTKHRCLKGFGGIPGFILAICRRRKVVLFSQTESSMGQHFTHWWVCACTGCNWVCTFSHVVEAVANMSPVSITSPHPVFQSFVQPR